MLDGEKEVSLLKAWARDQQILPGQGGAVPGAQLQALFSPRGGWKQSWSTAGPNAHVWGSHCGKAGGPQGALHLGLCPLSPQGWGEEAAPCSPT